MMNSIHMFKDNQRRLAIENYLLEHAPQTLEEIIDGFALINQKLPFVETGKNAVREWLSTISEVDSRLVNGVTKYSLSNKAANKRKNLSPLPTIHSPAPKRHMATDLKQQKVTSQLVNRGGYQQPRPKQPQNHFRQTQAMKNGAPHLYGIPLVGDENFLNMAVFDMKFKPVPHKSPRQCGGCVSGLRISDATRFVYNMEEDAVDRIIVNVGSVDVAEGRQLIEMIHDTKEFLHACTQMQINPILTTLAPLPAHQHSNKKEVLKGFNDFIRHCVSSFFSIIDLNKGLLHNDGSINFNLYQTGPRFISGSRKPFTIWNKIGRNRVQNMLVKNLGQAIVYDKNFIGDYF